MKFQYDDEFDDEEVEGLVTESPDQDNESTDSNGTRNGVVAKGYSSRESPSLSLQASFGLLVVVLVITVIVFQLYRVRRNPTTKPNELYQEPSSLSENSKVNTMDNINSPYFQCPQISLREHNVDEIEDYLRDDVGFNVTDEKYFLETFRTQKFDGWERTFDKFKETMRDFVTKFFVPNIKNGDSIYESACGIGLNLYATLEILQEEANITNLTIYGNEYLRESVEKGRSMLNVLLKAQDVPPPKNHLGSICQGDSTNLSGFVPSNAFDFVFTGYISPLWNPLQFNSTFNGNYELLRHVCDGETWEDEKLRVIAQQRQKDWFSSWVTEMVRIAKPGAPIVAEEVAPPYCSARNDWGGVNREFWEQGAFRYGWDIDPRSVVVVTRDNIKRYHVFMRKNDHGR